MAFVEGGDDVGAVWGVLVVVVGSGVGWTCSFELLRCGDGDALGARECVGRRFKAVGVLDLACDAVAWSRCWSSWGLIGKS